MWWAEPPPSHAPVTRQSSLGKCSLVDQASVGGFVLGGQGSCAPLLTVNIRSYGKINNWQDSDIILSSGEAELVFRVQMAGSQRTWRFHMCLRTVPCTTGQAMEIKAFKSLYLITNKVIFNYNFDCLVVLENRKSRRSINATPCCNGCCSCTGAAVCCPEPVCHAVPPPPHARHLGISRLTL